jgi:hypothetical protein
MFVSAVEAAPIIGDYKSPELGGADLLNGRWAESFAGGGQGQVGNLINAASWNGTQLGTQWLLSDPNLQQVSVMYDHVIGGNGQIAYVTTYDGGEMTLKVSGPDNYPWAGAGDVDDYVIEIDSYTHLTTVQWLGGQVVDIRSTVLMDGTFRDYEGYGLAFLVATAAQLGEGELPDDYPEYLGAETGHFGIIQKINMEIVPEPMTSVLLGVSGLMIVIRRRTK